MKAFGKNKTYYSNQDLLARPDPEKVKQAEKELVLVRETLQTAQQEQQKLAMRLAEVAQLKQAQSDGKNSVATNRANVKTQKD